MTQREDNIPLSQSAESQVRACRLLVTIPFYFRDDRLRFLSEVCRAFSEYRVASLLLIVQTNTNKTDQIERIEGLLRQFKTIEFEIQVRDSLSDPHLLVWEHRPIILERFLDESSTFTHFVYVEDDIRVSYANFSYFVESRMILASKLSLPSFLRVEYSRRHNKYMATDVTRKSPLNTVPFVDAGGHRFVALPDPYCGTYILDRPLAVEFKLSQSFTQEGAASRIHWELRERAAMGLVLENIPSFFPHRYVVPLAGSNSVANYAWIEHLPSNYADIDGGIFATISADDLFL